MPISKTCYFCEIKATCNHGCIDYTDDNCNKFTPNADWLYIERLEKENEELKHQLADALMRPTGTNSTNIDTSFGGVVDLCPNETCRHREKTSCYFPNCLD